MDRHPCQDWIDNTFAKKVQTVSSVSCSTCGRVSSALKGWGYVYVSVSKHVGYNPFPFKMYCPRCFKEKTEPKNKGQMSLF